MTHEYIKNDFKTTNQNKLIRKLQLKEKEKQKKDSIERDWWLHYEYINEKPRTDTTEYKNGITCTVEYQRYRKIETWFKNGLKHRDSDKPAIIEYHENGLKSLESWYVNGKQHRDNSLPAVIGYRRTGKKELEEWWVDGQLHRDNGKPARIVVGPYFYHYKEWFVNGLRHRENDLPAWTGHTEEEGRFERWFIDGKAHRDNGKPAVICYSTETGYVCHEEWFVNGCEVDYPIEKPQKIIDVPVWMFDNV